MELSHIDHGRRFDWGRASADYAAYRDIYPDEFYQRLLAYGIGTEGQRVLDLGTGTGVLPRAMARFGASFTGIDASENQIAAARRLAAEAGLAIDYRVRPAEDTGLDAHSFDAVTACQCFWYFDKPKALAEIARVLKPAGKLAILSMAWLPGESEIAQRSEELVLKYNPDWTGGGFVRTAPKEPEWADTYGLKTLHLDGFDVSIPFTRETWQGRMRACRGVAASLGGDALQSFEREHTELLARIAPVAFAIPHYVEMLVFQAGDSVCGRHV